MKRRGAPSLRTVRMLLAAMAVTLLAPATAVAQAQASETPTPAAATPTPAPGATPYPEQDAPPVNVGVPGVPPGYDEAIEPPATQGSNGEAVVATPAPTPLDDFMTPPPASHEDDWDPNRMFPGNYAALPLSVELAFSDCLSCKAPPNTKFLDSPGFGSVWLGYAFQPMAKISAPFVAAGIDFTFYEKTEDGLTKNPIMITPTWRWGWNWTGANVYVNTGLILPGEDRDHVGYHVGLGGSSFALLAVAVCVGEAIPSVYEIGYDWLPPDKITHESRDRWLLKLGWGF